MIKASAFALALLVSVPLMWGAAHGQGGDASVVFTSANKSLLEGRYADAIAEYDEILAGHPSNAGVLKLKGIALANTGEHAESLRQFYRVLQLHPQDGVALSGMGLGLGNLGEYHESLLYFEDALALDPQSRVAQNYLGSVKGILAKYPYTPTPKPDGLGGLPGWFRQEAARWQSTGDGDGFARGLGYLAQSGALTVPPADRVIAIPDWLRGPAGWWAQGGITDGELLAAVEWLAANGHAEISHAPATQAQLERDAELFDSWLRAIQKAAKDELRFIVDPNPSRDVIKKFLRDYEKWNLEKNIGNISLGFPNPTLERGGDGYVLRYKVFVNDQPTGLPLDHVGTLRDSFGFWESRQLRAGGTDARVVFETTRDRGEANVLVTWVVRDLGESVLGHANLGKGIVEVVLGGHGCDGSFQLYAVDSVMTVMTHELGHSIGLGHSEVEGDIMYPTFSPTYAYCLLG